MSALAIYCAIKITLNLYFKPNNFHRTPLTNNVANISFRSQVAKSRISLKTPTGSRTTKPKTLVKAVDNPAESNESLYEVLKITDPENATSHDIEKAYKRMKKKYNPNAAPKNKVENYIKQLMMVQEAYETLSDPQKKAHYDKDYAKIVQQQEWRMSWKAQLELLKLHARDPHSWAAAVTAMPRPPNNYDPIDCDRNDPTDCDGKDPTDCDSKDSTNF